jgi:hypothetical protein
MPTLTSQEGNELAMYFLGLAQAIGDYKFENWNSLSDADKDKLGKFQRSILNAGEDLLALSTTLVLNDVQEELNEIGNITKDIRKSINHLQSVQKVILIATNIVTLAGTIVSKNPLSIANAIIDLSTTWKANKPAH